MTAARGYYAPYTDRQAWRSEFDGFITNKVPIVRSLAKPCPLITVHPDRGLLTLIRALHRAPKREGDCEVAYVLACDVPIPEASLALKFTWSMPITYTMTIVTQVPDCLEWLSPALHAGVLACGLAPRPDLGFVGLPMPDDLHGQLVQLGLSIIFHLQRRNASRN
jgi:hypothetical protein